MSYFRPIDTTLGEEQVEQSRKEKLRCACLRPRERAGQGGELGVSPPRLLLASLIVHSPAVCDLLRLQGGSQGDVVPGFQLAPQFNSV